LLATAAAPGARAQGVPVSVGVRASTLGLGGEIALGLTDRVEVRGVGNYFSLDRDFDWSDITYGADLKLRSAAALIDLYAGPLRLTGGGMWNGNKLAGTATPNATVQIGDTTYSDADIGTLTAGMTFRKFAPYLGLGLGGRGKVGFFFDLGIVFQGSPEITYTATTSLTGAARTYFDQQVQREIDNIDEDLRLFKYYPVVSLGLRFRLN
jgi:hypothetical protein